MPGVEQPVRTIDQTGTTNYRDSKGYYHRLDGPAVIYKNGDESWYQYGKLHRDGGPAMTSENGGKTWFQYGLKHREDGPAVEDKSGWTAYYLKGVRVKRGSLTMKIILEKERRNARAQAQDKNIKNITGKKDRR